MHFVPVITLTFCRSIQDTNILS